MTDSAAPAIDQQRLAAVQQKLAEATQALDDEPDDTEEPDAIDEHLDIVDLVTEIAGVWGDAGNADFKTIEETLHDAQDLLLRSAIRLGRIRAGSRAALARYRQEHGDG